jgi:exodeoxyribonuclease V alpha subunit
VLDTIHGTVEKTRFRNDENGWTIMVAHVEGEGSSLGVVGPLAARVADGLDFEARGRWEHHAKFGRQFKFDALTILPPSTTKQILARLVTYPGIGEKTADAIVDKFTSDTWQIMDEEIHRLLEVKGIGTAGLEKIKNHHALQHGPVADLQNRLIELSGRARLALRIHDVFGDRALEVLEQHPFQIADKVEGFGFGLANTISFAAGLDPASDERVDAGVMHSLVSKYNEGHCALPREELIAAAVKLLGLRKDIVAERVAHLTTAEGGRSLVERSDLLFARRMSWTEQAITNAVGMLSTAIHPVWDVGDLPDHLSAGQAEAVRSVSRAGMTIITGGPGTGKSTVVDTVLKVAAREGVNVILCAPTGRAAKRLTETTGHEAKTIHRLLGTIPGTMSFRHDAQNPLPAGLVVIDEYSMVDARIAESLFIALTRDHRVLIVGDADQLPSVGPGNVLRDLIEALDHDGSPVPVVRLAEVFRQAKGSPIIANAHNINSGDALEPDPPSRGSDGEFFVLRAGTPAAAHRTIIDMASVRVPAAYGLDRMTEVQILCPMNAKGAGMVRTDNFNETLQRMYTVRDGVEGFGYEGKWFWLGDRVMQTRNDYDRNVFNGDIGTVINIDHEGQKPDTDAPTMTVDFDGTIADYTRADLQPLRLAYATSIHKSQGSEFPAVLIPILSCHSIMLRRNLLYTAVTRARQLCVIVGEPRAIEKAIATADASKRWTGLANRIREALGRGNTRGAVG